MKILMVNKFLYPKGGSETYMFELTQYLRNKGHEVAFFGMYDNRNTVNMSKSELVSNLEFRKISLSSLSYPFRIIYSLEARRKIRKLIKKFQPDIVHLNNYNFQITPSIIYEIKQHNIPIVQTLHDYAIICPDHNLYNFQKSEVCEKCKNQKYINCIKSKCVHNSYIKSILSAFEGYLYHKLKTYNYINTFICPSRFIASKVVEFGQSEEKIKVLHNFITNYPENEYLKKDYVLYFGRISEEKGIGNLLKAVEQLPHIKFVFAGSGSMEHELKKYENIEYIGFKTGAELTLYIGQALFTVYPSEYYDNCPMSILESQALGTPVIASEIGGIPELIKDNYSGFLVEPKNTYELIDKIDTLYSKRRLLNQFSSRCRQEMQQYSIESYYEEIIKIYRETIKA